MPSRPFSEIDLIERIRQQCPVSGERVLQSIGDDCAVFRPHGEELLLVSTDTLVEGVHFDRSFHPPDLLGRKTASVNLSDIAAMGGLPCYGLLSLALPAASESVWLDAFISGFLAVFREHGVLLLGGDTVKSGLELMFSVTVIGAVAANQVLYRSTAREGDLVWLSGSPGLAAAGLELLQAGLPEAKKKFPELCRAHLDPAPEVALGQLLAKSGLVHAMMDSSDGLATDLAHICRASKVGAEINSQDLPVSAALEQAAAILQRPALAWALKGGEDYHLLFTSPAAHRLALSSLILEQTGRDIHCIGRITGGSGVTLVTPEGSTDITFQGFDHFAS